MNDVAPDGRRFRVYERRCLHSDCWAAACECGHVLTAHDFDADGARRGALEVLCRRDPLARRGFAHPLDQCSAPRRRPLVRVVAPTFVAGIEADESGRVVSAAPILRRALLGKTGAEVAAICAARGWRWERVE